MSRKSVNSDSASKCKKIRNELMNFEKDEIKKVKNSNKELKVTKFEDSDKKISTSKYSLTVKKFEEVNMENVNPKIEIIEKCEDNNNKNENDEVGSSDLSDENDD